MSDDVNTPREQSNPTGKPPEPSAADRVLAGARAYRVTFKEGFACLLIAATEEDVRSELSGMGAVQVNPLPFDVVITAPVAMAVAESFLATLRRAKEAKEGGGSPS